MSVCVCLPVLKSETKTLPQTMATPSLTWREQSWKGGSSGRGGWRGVPHFCAQQGGRRPPLDPKVLLGGVYVCVSETAPPPLLLPNSISSSLPPSSPRKKPLYDLLKQTNKPQPQEVRAQYRQSFVMVDHPPPRPPLPLASSYSCQACLWAAPL